MVCGLVGIVLGCCLRLCLCEFVLIYGFGVFGFVVLLLWAVFVCGVGLTCLVVCLVLIVVV